MVITRNPQNLWSYEDILPQLVKFMKQSVTTQVQSFPYFTLETFLAILICVLYALLYMDIGFINKNINTSKSASLYSRIRGSLSATSDEINNTLYSRSRKRTKGSISYINISPKISENSQFTMQEMGDSERRRFGEQLVRMSPKQFAKLDRHRQLNKKLSGKNMNSLTTLCDNVIHHRYSPKVLKHQVEEAREDLLCNKSSKSKLVDIQSDIVTDSILHLYGNVVTNSCLNKPLPFKGDITTLALDAAELCIDGNEYVKELNKLKSWEQSLPDQDSFSFDQTVINCDMLSEGSSTT